MYEINLTEDAIRGAIIRNNLTIEEAQFFCNELNAITALQQPTLKHLHTIVAAVRMIPKLSEKKPETDIGDITATIEKETQTIIELTNESLKHINNIQTMFPQDFSTSLGIDKMRSNSQDFINEMSYVRRKPLDYIDFFMQFPTSLVSSLNN